MEKRRVDDDAGLPTQAMLDEIESAIGGLQEFLIHPAALAVRKVANPGTPNSITHEDIGRLIVWADNVCDVSSSMVEDAAMVNVAAREVYAVARGYEGDGSSFTDYGSVGDRGRADFVARRFADVYSPATADVQSAVGRVSEGWATGHFPSVACGQFQLRTLASSSTPTSPWPVGRAGRLSRPLRVAYEAKRA